MAEKKDVQKEKDPITFAEFLESIPPYSAIWSTF